MASYRVGVDIGGTHTDFVILDLGSGISQIEKVPSTPDNPAIAVFHGLERLRARGIDPSDITFFGHGTTVTTNALLEAKGVQIGLLINEGFRGVQEAQTQARDGNSFDYTFRRPRPLALQRFTREIPGRIDASGREIQPLDVPVAQCRLQELVDLGVRSFAVCFLFSFLNPEHEQQIGELIHRLAPDASVSLSSRVLPRIREWPRLSTTVVNAYLEPILVKYINDMSTALDQAHVIRPQRFLMQSNGGLMPFRRAAIGGATVHTLVSGPAAGVQAAAHVLSRQQGHQHVITFDMGGTSCDIAFISNGEPLEIAESVVARHSVDVPSLEIATIAAGGGTVAWRDDAGFLNVGPMSAGAVPGPACYGLGGTRATVTDADLICGYLDPEGFLGGTQKLIKTAAQDAVRSLADPLGMSEIECAMGINRLIDARMADEVRIQAAQRAIDLSQYVLVPFGGGGPVHAASVAKQLGIGRVVIPPQPGAFSALGLLCTDVVHDYIRSGLSLVSTLDPEVAHAMYDDLEGMADRHLTEEALSLSMRSLERTIDLRYAGQGYELNVPISGGSVSRESLAHAIARFHEAHLRLYGHSHVDQPVEVVSYRLRARVPVPKYRGIEAVQPAVTQAPVATKVVLAYFSRDGLEHLETSVFNRDDLAPGNVMTGPSIITQFDTTTLVPPGWTASVDAYRNLVLEALRCP